MASSMKSKKVNTTRRSTPLCKALKVASQVKPKKNVVKKACTQSSARPTSKATGQRILNKHGKVVSMVRHCAGKKAQEKWLDLQLTQAVASDRVRQATALSKVVEPLGKTVGFAQSEFFARKKEMEEQSAELDRLKKSEESSRQRVTELRQAADVAASELPGKVQEARIAENKLKEIETSLQELLAEQGRADQAHKDALAAALSAETEVGVANRARDEEIRNLESINERIARAKENVDQAKGKSEAAFSHALIVTNASDPKRDVPTTPRRRPSREHQRQSLTPQKRAKKSCNSH